MQAWKVIDAQVDALRAAARGRHADRALVAAAAVVTALADDVARERAGAASGDSLVSIAEAAEKLGCKRGWLYANHHQLPFAIRLGERRLRFSVRGIEAWIAERRTADVA